MTIFTHGDRPKAGRGEASFWLPLMALFTGARLNELAPLTAADVKTDVATGIVFIDIKEDSGKVAASRMLVLLASCQCILS